MRKTLKLRSTLRAMAERIVINTGPLIALTRMDALHIMTPTRRLHCSQRQTIKLSRMNPKMKDQNTFSPRPYLSWSQIRLFERSPELYAKKYFYEEEEAASEAMRLGKRLAQAIELQDATGDNAIGNLIAFFPTYPQREFKIEATLEGVDVPLYGILDGFDETQLRIGEYKSGRLWDQNMVDESGQLKMYELMVWLKYKSMPSEVMLHWARTQYNDQGELEFTGEIQSFEARFTLEDILLFSSRVRKVWAGIKELCKEHYKMID